MQTTQHGNTRCTVYLHPAVATSPDAVKKIQLRLGQLVIVHVPRATTGPSSIVVVARDDQGPWGGDAA
ncbi:hypothetical protein FKZ69_14710 [Pseudomonas azotoformans]|nr:hypothetical protein FKZ69_14710 [Pseudomonas azotoformans]